MFNLDESLKIKIYASQNGLNFTQAVKDLTNQALSFNKLEEEKIELNKKIDKLTFELNYVKKLLEQTYSDFQLDNLTNPRDCLLLKEFKKNIRKDLQND